MLNNGLTKLLLLQNAIPVVESATAGCLNVVIRLQTDFSEEVLPTVLLYELLDSRYFYRTASLRREA